MEIIQPSQATTSMFPRRCDLVLHRCNAYLFNIYYAFPTQVGLESSNNHAVSLRSHIRSLPHTSSSPTPWCGNLQKNFCRNHECYFNAPYNPQAPSTCRARCLRTRRNERGRLKRMKKGPAKSLQQISLPATSI